MSETDRLQKEQLLSGFLLELRRSTVILCVLASLREPAYGYSLIASLGQRGVAVEANTLYPLLRRLEGQGLLQSQWNTEAAKPRKFYSTTPFGQEVLAELKSHWLANAETMNRIL